MEPVVADAEGDRPAGGGHVSALADQFGEQPARYALLGGDGAQALALVEVEASQHLRGVPGAQPTAAAVGTAGESGRAGAGVWRRVACEQVSDVVEGGAELDGYGAQRRGAADQVMELMEVDALVVARAGQVEPIQELLGRWVPADGFIDAAAAKESRGRRLEVREQGGGQLGRELGPAGAVGRSDRAVRGGGVGGVVAGEQHVGEQAGVGVPDPGGGDADVIADRGPCVGVEQVVVAQRPAAFVVDGPLVDVEVGGEAVEGVGDTRPGRAATEVLEGSGEPAALHALAQLTARGCERHTAADQGNGS